MAAITLRLPPNCGLGIGFWRDLLENLAAAKSCIADNDYSEDSHDSSSDSLEVDNTFDPATNTVTEFENAIQEIIDSLRGTE
jgi:hypothetical protein